MDRVRDFEIPEMDWVQVFEIQLLREISVFTHFLQIYNYKSFKSFYTFMISEPSFTIYQILPRHGRITLRVSGLFVASEMTEM